MDALDQSHPIEVEVPHARSVLEFFDYISYKKGSAIIRMLQDFIGDCIFQKSLSSYMKRYARRNAKTEDLWSVLSEESGLQVNVMMDTWTKQKGYPVIFVKSKDHILEFEQSHFMLSGLHGDGQWIVPITLSVGSYNKRKNFLLDTKVGRLDVSELLHSPDGNSSSFEKKNLEMCDENLWIKLNIEQTGFYRVKYEDKLAARLKKAIEKNWLLEADKFGILDDTYALCEACELPLSSLLTLMDVYRKELDCIVLSKLIDICYNIATISADAIPNLTKELKQFFIYLLLSSAERLGWESMCGESHLSTMLRERVLMALAMFGHDETHKEAMKRFQTFLDDRNTPLLPVDTRRAAYIAVMRDASTINRNGFESLLNVYREADAVQEKTRILRCMASSPDPNIVLEVLNLLFSDEVREQDVNYVLLGICSEGREAAWTWFKENWDRILNKWGPMLLTRFVRDIVTPFCSDEKADEIEEFFKSRVNRSIAMTLKQSVEQVRIKARWVHNIKHEHDQSLEELVRGLACRG
ncbi:hypothetical protein L1049_005329 [Liquidambar formosana]|uniref:Aminopeptidase n=1 Tax=Liquidambar formosana TaxID=63359 RepID=A0AAP0WXK5_LIQFO